MSRSNPCPKPPKCLQWWPQLNHLPWQEQTSRQSRKSLPPGKQDFQGMKVPTCQAQGRGANATWATCHQFCATLSVPTKVGGLRDGCGVNRLHGQEVTHAQSLRSAYNGSRNLTTCHGRNRPAIAPQLPCVHQLDSCTCTTLHPWRNSHIHGCCSLRLNKDRGWVALFASVECQAQ